MAQQTTVKWVDDLDGSEASPAARTQSGRPTSREDSILIRKWARERGHELADRGRIPGKILEAYRAEH
jgi:hypothetical protein